MEDNVKHVSEIAQRDIIEALRDADRIRIFNCEQCGGRVEILIGVTIAYSVDINKGLKVAGEVTLITNDALTDWVLRCQSCGYEPQNIPGWLREDISRHISYGTVSERRATHLRLNGGE